MWVGDQTAFAVWNVFSQSQENVFRGQKEIRTRLCVTQNDAIVTDFNFGDGDAVFGAFFEFSTFDTTRSVRNIRVLHANAGAKQFHAAARTS